MATITTPPLELVYLNDLGFMKALNNLRKKGAHPRVHEETLSIMERLRQGEDVSNKITHKGESRIKGCIKYELGSGAHRLVTVHTSHFIYLLFVGSHDDVDRWLDSKRGLTITCNPQSREVKVTIVSDVRHERPIPHHNFEHAPIEDTPYLKRMPGEINLSNFSLSRPLIRELERINDESSDDLILEVIEDIARESPNLATVFLDILSLVREGKPDAAAERIKTYTEEVVSIQDIPELEEEAIHDDVNSEDLIVLSGLNDTDYQKILEPERFQEWILFPHPEQKSISVEEFTKPAILSGVSGSGKTCVLLHRARHLASKYPNEKIGILTLNRSLARLLQNLLEELCSVEEVQRIEVYAFYDYFKRLVDHFGPTAELNNFTALIEGLDVDEEERIHLRKISKNVKPETYAREFDPLSGETLDDTWRIFMDNPEVATLMTYFKEHIFTYDDWADSHTYLREEFSLIRSAVSTSARNKEYTKPSFTRMGRCIPFPKKTRKQVLDLLVHFEAEMLFGGVLDELALTLAILPHIGALRNLPENLKFRCLLIDEFQDLSTRDLTILRRVVPITEPDAFFLCGDNVQKVLVKTLDLNKAGLASVDTTRRAIKKNYRNSKNILLAASTLAQIYSEQAKSQKEDIDVLDPELAIRETAWPLAIETHSENEISQAWEQAREVIESGGNLAWSVCLVTACNEGAYSVDALIAECPKDFPIEIERLSGDYTRHQDTMSVASMSDVKGFEFSMVIIVGCGAKTLPNPGRPREEVWRDALRLYVAMTRARDSVQLCYSGEPSPFLTDMNEHIEWLELLEKSSND
jgi:superfamily I DNA/RNA helicase